MSIFYHESSREFHLTNGQVSYIMEIMENGQMEQLYYGKKECSYIVSCCAVL